MIRKGGMILDIDYSVILGSLKREILEGYRISGNPNNIIEVKTKFKQMDRQKHLVFIRDSMHQLISENKESFNESFDGIIEDYVKDVGKTAEMLKTTFELDIQKQIAKDVWNRLLSPEGKGNFNVLFNHGYLHLIIRIEKACDVRELFPYERKLHDDMLTMMNTSTIQGQNIIQELFETPVGPPHAVEDSNLFMKMMSEISHEMLGTLLCLPYCEILQHGNI
jgi:hypothetical protein